METIINQSWYVQKVSNQNEALEDPPFLGTDSHDFNLTIGGPAFSPSSDLLKLVGLHNSNFSQQIKAPRRVMIQKIFGLCYSDGSNNALKRHQNRTLSLVETVFFVIRGNRNDNPPTKNHWVTCQAGLAYCYSKYAYR